LKSHIGYHCLFFPPADIFVEVDLQRLLLEWVLVALTALALLLRSQKERGFGSSDEGSMLWAPSL
jgi:hypothetical protein